MMDTGRSGGASLPHDSRTFFESRIGHDLSGVRVHRGASANEAAHSINAKAFTKGNDIVFGDGYYSPNTPEGKKLLAHELTHVAQQSSRGPTPSIQRDKIDHREIGWADFKGKVPKKAKYDAQVSSGFHTPEWSKIDDYVVETEDTGEACTAGKGKKKTESTTYKATAYVDPTLIEVKPYMLQEKSWARSWLYDEKAREKKCQKDAVSKCEKAITKQYKKIENKGKKLKNQCIKAFSKEEKIAKKSCNKEKNRCKRAFKKGDTDYIIETDNCYLEAYSKEDCSTSFYDECVDCIMEEFSFSPKSMEVEVYSKDDCQPTFEVEYVEDAKEGVSWSWRFDPIETEAEAMDLSECSTVVLDTCKNEIFPAYSDYLLGHEQGHFDITNVMAERTEEAMRELAEDYSVEVTACGKENAEKAALKALKKKKPIKKLKKKYKKSGKTLSSTQKSYDKQTKHGKSVENQETWSAEEIPMGLPKISIP